MAEKEPSLRSSGPRLSPIGRERELLPWRRATELEMCSLYWLPIRSFPVPPDQRQWLLRFFDLLSDSVTSDKSLRLEQFVQLKTLQSELRGPFLENAHQLAPMLGLSRRPGAKFPPPPTDEDTKAMQEGRKKFDFNEFNADYCYWLRGQSHGAQRVLFFGYGGTTMVFLKPDAGSQVTKPTFSPKLKENPLFKPLFAQFDVEKGQAAAHALLEEFLPKSKKLFGAGLEKDARFRGLLFILPLLQSSDFFSQPALECAKWFEFCDIYVTENRVDGGVLLASKKPLDDLLIGLVRDMIKDGRLYSE